MQKGEDNLMRALELQLGTSQARIAIETIRRHIEANPELIEEIFPGKRLVDRKLSRAEVTKIMLERGRQTIDRQTEKRYEVLVPAIQAMIDEDPDISLRQIATRLQQKGLKPLRSEKWSSSSVRFLMNKAGIKRGDE